MKNRILIVEDSVLSRSFIKNILSEKDVVIEEAVNGIDGLEKIKSFKPDIIFLDLLMPELDGFGVLEKNERKRFRHSCNNTYSRYTGNN